MIPIRSIPLERRVHARAYLPGHRSRAGYTDGRRTGRAGRSGVADVLVFAFVNFITTITPTTRCAEANPEIVEVFAAVPDAVEHVP